MVVAFSHVGYPGGKFAFTNAISHINCKKLFLNCPGNSWYQVGVPGLGVGIKDCAAGLSTIIESIGVKKTIFLGMSMGGYAALLFGFLCKANFILAFTSEIQIGNELSRSYRENKVRKFDPMYTNLTPLFYTNQTSLVFLIYGEDDLLDLSLLWPISLQILERKKVHFFLSKGGHQFTLQLNLPLILMSLISDSWLSRGTINPDRIRNYSYSVDEFFIYSVLKNLLDGGRCVDAVDFLSGENIVLYRENLRKILDEISV